MARKWSGSFLAIALGLAVVLLQAVAGAVPAAPNAATIPAPLTTGLCQAACSLITTTPIYAIRGAGLSPALLNQEITMAGIVTGTSGNTFYIQTPDHLTDNDPRTTEGVRVYLGQHEVAPQLIGKPVVIRAKITMYRKSGKDDLYVCEAVSVQWQSCPHLYQRETITPTVIDTPTWPMPDKVHTGKLDEAACLTYRTCPLLDVEHNALDYLTAMQHMLVTVKKPRVIQPTGRYRDTWITWGPPDAADGEVTRDGLHLTVRQGGASVKKLLLEGQLLDKEGRRIDTDMFALGDEFAGDEITGILDYRYGTFMLLPVHQVHRKSRPVAAPLVDTTQQLVEMAALAVHGQGVAYGGFPVNKASPGFRVATYNLENFNAIEPNSCMRARIQAEHIVYDLGSPDVVGVQEVQDNDGEKKSTLVAADISFALLASWSQQSGGPAYNYVQVDPENGKDGGVPGGNIRQGFLYNTAKATLLPQYETGKAGPLDACAVLAGDGAAAGAMINFNPCRIAPQNPAFDNSRKPLLAGFQSKNTGRRYWMVNVHLASMAGSAPQYGAIQPPPPYREDVREAQIAEVLTFVQALEQADPEASIILLGDFNDFYYTPALQQLWGAGGKLESGFPRKLLEAAPTGMANAMWQELPEGQRWTYVYQGDAQALDHVFVGGLAPPVVCSVKVPHVNTRAPLSLAASDHDPIAVDLDCAA